MSGHPSSSDLLGQADQAERKGDRVAAVSKLRAYLAERERPQLGGAQTQHIDDGRVRLRLARLLMSLDETASARSVLLPLDDADDPSWAGQPNRLLASLDEGDGALTSAQIRWERVLADDIDDAEAQSRLRLLRPYEAPEGWPASLSVGTLAAPEGVRLSRFRMIRELGRGSTAAVYLVRDERLDLPLALKVLHPQLAATARAEARERFFAEARLAACLRHPGVVAIYGIDQETRCLAMEYVAGGTMRDLLRSARAVEAEASLRPRISPWSALAIARSLLRALAHVHGAGIVHGDLKPGNVLLRTPTDVVLADFGVAQLATASPTVSDRTAGTPLYLAPEQFRGASPSPRTDLFAAGAILWELLHGRPARRQADLLAGQYAAPLLPDPSPTALTRLIDALMAGPPDLRPASAEAALATLGAATLS